MKQKSNNKKIFEAVNNQQSQKIDNILDEPLTIALVLRGSAEDIQELKTFLTQNKLQLIYKTISYGHLFITTKKEEEHD